MARMRDGSGKALSFEMRWVPTLPVAPVINNSMVTPSLARKHRANRGALDQRAFNLDLGCGGQAARRPLEDQFDGLRSHFIVGKQDGGERWPGELGNFAVVIT